MSANNMFSIALFGIDNKRCDMIMILSADAKNKEMRLSAADGSDKINQAYMANGPQAGVAALNESNGIKADHYVVFDFAGLDKLIDMVGGIDSCVIDDKQTVLRAIYTKARALPAYQYPKLAKECLALCQTNLKAKDITALLSLLLKKTKVVWEQN